MFLRRFKLSHTRCFLPSVLFNRNVNDEEGTEVLDNTINGGWQGVVKAFSPDEDGNPSADVRGILSTVCFSALMGGVYGSLSYSKRAYDDFFEKNQSTLFQNQFEAKAKLQTQVSLAMAKGIFKWGTRVALFCGPFAVIVAGMNAFMNKDVAVISYTTAGCAVGGFARLSLGPKGFVVGSTLGALLGTMVGSLTLLLLKFTPVSMQEIKEWQNENQKERDLKFVQEQKQSIVFKYDKPPIMIEHEKRLQNSKTDSNSAP